MLAELKCSCTHQFLNCSNTKFPAWHKASADGIVAYRHEFYKTSLLTPKYYYLDKNVLFYYRVRKFYLKHTKRSHVSLMELSYNGGMNICIYERCASAEDTFVFAAIYRFEQWRKS